MKLILFLTFECIMVSFCSAPQKLSPLIGVWGPSISENASFRIQRDSIYYLEHFKSYKYATRKDSIYIRYDGWTFKGIFFFRNDSLILRANGKESKFVRIKN
jgi:hypothetical protein